MLTPCSDRDRLERFLNDDLPSEDAASVESHLDVEKCPSCNAVVESLQDRREAGGLSYSIIQGAILKAISPSGSGESELPAKVGRYTVVGLISDGMERVVEAVDEQDARFAVKLLPLDFGVGGERRRRFWLQAFVHRRLVHDHIVPCVEHGTTSTTAYLVTPLLSKSLDKHQETTSPDLAARWIRQIASAVAYMHGQGFLHRDIKPANVLLDDKNQAFISDFGIVKAFEDQAPSVTNPSDNPGTPAYMDPVAKQSKASITGDIYGLGGVLHFLLTGRGPKEPETLVADIGNAVSSPKPRFTPTPDVPRDLDAICRRCLATDPEARYQSCDELLAHLDAYLAGRKLPRVGPGAWSQLMRIARRNVAATALAAALAATVVVMLLVFAIGNVRLKQANADLNSANAGLNIANAGLKQANVDLERSRTAQLIVNGEAFLAIAEGLLAMATSAERGDDPNQMRASYCRTMEDRCESLMQNKHLDDMTRAQVTLMLARMYKLLANSRTLADSDRKAYRLRASELLEPLSRSVVISEDSSYGIAERLSDQVDIEGDLADLATMSDDEESALAEKHLNAALEIAMNARSIPGFGDFGTYHKLFGRVEIFRLNNHLSAERRVGCILRMKAVLDAVPDPTTDVMLLKVLCDGLRQESEAVKDETVYAGMYRRLMEVEEGLLTNSDLARMRLEELWYNLLMRDDHAFRRSSVDKMSMEAAAQFHRQQIAEWRRYGVDKLDSSNSEFVAKQLARRSDQILANSDLAKTLADEMTWLRDTTLTCLERAARSGWHDPDKVPDQPVFDHLRKIDRFRALETSLGETPNSERRRGQ
jgi:hypothetical protein